MGNSLSYNIRNRDELEHDDNGKNSGNNESLLKAIDEIASNYLFQQNIVDMLRFSDSNYRDNFTVLTCKILDEKLTNLDIASMKNRIINKDKVPKIGNYGELVYFSELDKIKSSLDNEEEKKEALLIISKFYVKIFTLFSSIVSVVDPQYTYKDENGEDNYFYLKDYDDLKMIDTNTNKLKLYHLENPLSLVKRRLFILKNKLEQQDYNSDYIVLNPGEELCSMNIPENDEGVFKLSNEIGIKELDNLYYDLYDDESSQWSGRSKEMEEQYKRDVTLFFQIFTGQKKKPSKVKTFADIELLDFHNLPRCKNNDYFEDLLVSKNDVLFQKYLTKIDEIQQGTRSYKKQLLYILKSMFVKNEEGTQEQCNSCEIKYIIHPELDMKKLYEKQKKVQSCIVEMYTNCEKKFIEALLLYEKMYENRYGELVNSQVQNIAFNKNNNISNTRQKNKTDYESTNNIILNGNLLLDEKIKMPNMNSNRFKFSNKSNSSSKIPVQTPTPSPISTPSINSNNNNNNNNNNNIGTFENTIKPQEITENNEKILQANSEIINSSKENEQVQPQKENSEQLQPQVQPEVHQENSEQLQPQPQQTNSEQPQVQSEVYQENSEQLQPQPQQTNSEQPQVQPEVYQENSEQLQPQPQQTNSEQPQVQPEVYQENSEQLQPQPQQTNSEQPQVQPEVYQENSEQLQPQPQQTNSEQPQVQSEVYQENSEQLQPQPQQTNSDQPQVYQENSEQLQPQVQQTNSEQKSLSDLQKELMYLPKENVNGKSKKSFADSGEQAKKSLMSFFS